MLFAVVCRHFQSSFKINRRSYKINQNGRCSRVAFKNWRREGNKWIQNLLPLTRDPLPGMRLPVRIIRQTPWQNPKAIKRSPQCDCSAYAIEQRAGPNGKFPWRNFFSCPNWTRTRRRLWLFLLEQIQFQYVKIFKLKLFQSSYLKVFMYVEKSHLLLLYLFFSL